MTRNLFLLSALWMTVAQTENLVASNASFEGWQRHSQEILHEPGLLRYYTFESVEKDAVPNLAGTEGALTFRPVKKDGSSHPEMIPGRWAQKKAVRLDREAFDAPAFPVDRAFTLSAWVRLNGQGAYRGNNESTNGTLFSSGTGYTEGWRLTINHPQRTLVFSLGRPVEKSFSATSAATAASVWQHLAVTWDGSQMCIYANGTLIGSGSFAGNYTPGKNLRIGFANAGVGSVRMDLDEVAVYGRALPMAEIVRQAHFYAALPEDAARQVAAASRHFADKDYAAAVVAWQSIASQKNLHVDYRAMALLELSRSLIAQRQSNEAASAAAEVLQLPGVAARHLCNAELALLRLLPQIASSRVPVEVYQRLLGLEGLSPAEEIVILRQLAQRYRDTADPKQALVQYRKLLGNAALSPCEKLDLHLQIGHTCVEAKDYATARAEYESVRQGTDAPAFYQTDSLFCLADLCQFQGDLAGARQQLSLVATVPGAPPHHVWEAQQRLRELDRFAAGKPARDSIDSRSASLDWPKPGAQFFVAPNGRDDNPGTEAKPFATLERARDAIRTLKKQSGGLPAGGVNVILRGGTYAVRQSFRLSAEDSGTAQGPVVYSAYPGETVSLNGGARLSGFGPVRDSSILARLPEEVRGKVVQTDLRSQGIADLGIFEAGGYSSGRGFRTHPVLWLFFNGETMPLARWPNREYLEVGELLAKDSAFEHRGVPGTREGVFLYNGDRPRRWSRENDLWLYGFWFHDWADSYEKVDAIDTEKRSITLAAPYHHYGYRQGQRYYAINALSEIDQAGEWYLDRKSGTLYFYPPSDPATAVVEVSVCSSPLVQLDQVSHVRFRGLTWELGRGDGLIVRGGEACVLAGCTVRKLGGDAVKMTGDRHQVLGCDIFELGRGGITMNGGDRKTLRSGENVVENCNIHHLSRIDHTYTPAVLFRGVGIRVAHNLISHVNSSAMRIEGNDCIVEFNDVHHVVEESDDQGGVDMFGNPGYRGNVYRYNYWHDIGNGMRCGQAGIRLDDAISGTLIYGNVFYRCSDGGFGGVQIHGGKDNIVDNNLFIDCRSAVSFSPWGEKRYQEFLNRPDVQKLLYEQVDISKAPYSSRYPELADLTKNVDVNRIWRNLALNCGQFLARDRIGQVLMDNRSAGIDLQPASGAQGKFPVPLDSPALRAVGMRAIPVEEIGLYPDVLRKN